MIWASNNKWGSKLREKQAPQNRSTPRLLPPTWASAAESPGPKHQGQESCQGSPSLPLGLPKGPEHGATARQWPCEPSAPQRVNLHTATNFNLNHLLNPLHMRLRGSVMKQPKFSGHPNYWASFERQFMVWLQTEKLDKELWILGLMDCLTGKLRESTCNLYVERQNQGDPLTYEELYRSLKKKGSRLPEDHYRNRLENFRAIKKLFLEEIQIAGQDWEFLVQEAENSGEGLSEGEMKKILLSKLTPDTKQKIRDSQADQKVLGNWVQVRGLPETMEKMAVRELLHSISATGLKDITICEGRWRVGFHDSEQSEFFCSMVDRKVKYKGTVLRVRPWIFSYGVEQIWDQFEKYANLERQKSQDAHGFIGQVNAVGENGCSLCIAFGKEGRAATHTTAVKVLPWVVVGAGGLGTGKTSGAGTRGVSLDVVIGGRTGHSDTNGGESSDNRSKIHADCGPAENPSL